MSLHTAPTLRRWVRLLLRIALLLGLTGLTTTPVLVHRSQPLVLRAADEHPDATLRLIVQKSGDANVEQAVAALGGLVTRDLSIINAFAADVPARAVLPLSQMEGVRWISLDAPMVQAANGDRIDISRLKTAYTQAIRADHVWNQAPYLQGQGITVAVVDSGVQHNEFGRRILDSVEFVTNTHTKADQFGHGTHIAGIVGANGNDSQGAYIGVAPKVNLVNVKVCDDEGRGLMSDVVAGLQWVFNNRDRYNIRVVNLSLNSAVAESYHTSPLDAALELLWFKRIVVVVSAGNNGKARSALLYPPANDPFVITVGATDDRGTVDTGDDVPAAFSAHGTTEAGFAKPDLVAPGTNIVSQLSSRGVTLAKEHPDHVVQRDSFQMSGTSMSSAVTAGAAALLVQSNPRLTPDQIKFRLMATARPFGPGAGAGYLDIYAAVHSNTTASANIRLLPSHLLSTGRRPITWPSPNWNSVNWDSVNWDSVNWDSVNWDSDYWGQ